VPKLIRRDRDTAEVAKVLGVSTERVRLLAEKQLIPCSRRDYRIVYPPDQVELFAQVYKARRTAQSD
jgi:DNA-binding transcriptional MerR regulator